MTFSVTVDHFAYCPSPPRVVAVLDCRGRRVRQSEITDADAKGVTIGDRASHDLQLGALTSAAGGRRSNFSMR